jgi:hypothetical protein
VLIFALLPGSSNGECELGYNVTLLIWSTPLQGKDGTIVLGKRWALTRISEDGAKPFPSKGRIAVCHGSSSAEAILELPFASTKSTDEVGKAPAAIWVTVGLLAQDKFALQLKLKRTSRPTERDTASGTWHLYKAVAGAITTLDSISHGKENNPARGKAYSLLEMD